MIRLNLLPDVKLEYLRTKRAQARVISFATIVTIAAAGLVVLLGVWVYGGQALQKKVLTDNIEKHGQQLKNIADINEYLTIQNQLASLTKLHNGKNDFSRLLTYLPTLNPSAPNNVTLTSIDMQTDDSGNALSFQGEVRDYTALATFRDTLLKAELQMEDATEPLFETVVVSSGALEKSTGGAQVVVFRIDTTYNPNAFLSSVKKATVVVPQQTTTQSAQSAPEVFGTGSAKKEQP